MRKITADHIFSVCSPLIEKGVVIVDEKGKILKLDRLDNRASTTLEAFKDIMWEIGKR